MKERIAIVDGVRPHLYSGGALNITADDLERFL